MKRSGTTAEIRNWSDVVQVESSKDKGMIIKAFA